MTTNSIWDMSATAASNTEIGGVSIAEGMSPANVNDAIRATLAAIFKNQWGGTSGGTANAQTIALPIAPNAYVTGMTIWFIAGATNTSTMTLNLNSLGAKTVYADGVGCSGYEVRSGGIYCVVYDGTRFQLVSTSLGDVWRWQTIANALSGSTSVTYTSMPATAERIEVTCKNLSTDGTANPGLRVGAGSTPLSSGYSGTTSLIAGTGANSTLHSDRILLSAGWSAAVVMVCRVTLIKEAASDEWSYFIEGSTSDSARTVQGGGVIDAGGTLDRIQIYFGGTDQADGGNLSIRWR